MPFTTLDREPSSPALVVDSYLPDALRRALDYVGEHGFVASMRQRLHTRADAPYDNIV